MLSCTPHRRNLLSRHATQTAAQTNPERDEDGGQEKGYLVVVPGGQDVCEAKVAELRHALIVQQAVVHLPTNPCPLSQSVTLSPGFSALTIDDEGRGAEGRRP